MLFRLGSEDWDFRFSMGDLTIVVILVMILPICGKGWTFELFIGQLRA
jgi:hypothetical protein